MAEKLCSLKKIGGGGGSLTETVLWTNASPTSTFAAQVVTLSDDMNNYTYLKFEYRHSTTDSNLYEIIVPVDLYKTSLTPDSGNTTHYIPTISAMVGGQYAFSNIYARAIPYKTDTSIEVTSVRSLSGVSPALTNIIPTRIIGMK